jgi:hypothetical protein
LLLMCRVSCLDSLTHDTSAHTQIVLRRFTELLLLSGGSANHLKREERKTMGEIFWWVYRRTLVVGCVCVCYRKSIYDYYFVAWLILLFVFFFLRGVIGALIDTANEWWRGRREHGGIDEILRKLIFFCVLGFFLILLVSKFYQITFFCCCRL